MLNRVFAHMIASAAISPATVSSVTRNRGPIEGGLAGVLVAVITGTGYSTVSGAAGVTFGGTNAISYVVDSDTEITAVFPAHAAGAVDVVVTNGSGSPSTGGTGAFTYIDIKSTTWSVFQEDYAGSPWNGTTTSGTSASRAWTEATNAPSVGSQIGTTGLEPAAFIAANSDRLTLGNGETLDTIINNNAFTISVLLWPDSASAPAGAGSMWNDACILMDAGGWAGCSYTTSGFQVFAYPSSGDLAEVARTAATGGWRFCQSRLGSALLEGRVNGGARGSDTLGNGGLIGTMTSAVRMGSRTGSAGPYLDGKVAAVYVRDATSTDIEEDDLLDYVRRRFEIPLAA
jgi:hypothetical protein